MEKEVNISCYCGTVNLVFTLEVSNRSGRNIDLNEYSASEMVSVLCKQV